MGKWFYSFLFLLITALPFNTYAQPVNTAIGTELPFDGEPYLALNPTNNQNLVAAWMSERLTGGSYKIAITVRASFDGGNTWSTAVILPHYAATYGSADVSMAFDKSGLLYLCYIDFDEDAATGGDYVTRSANGGLTWDSATEVIDAADVAGNEPIDRPWLVVDNSNTANAGTLYITTKTATWGSSPDHNYYKVSTDSGHTWSAIAHVDGGNYLIGNIIKGPMAAPATTINGNFCAVYPSYVSSQNIYPAYYLATSKNKGQTFSYSTVIVADFAQVDTNLKVGYHLAANPADSNRFVFFEIDSSLGEPDIMAIHSNDGGQTWSSRVRVNDDPVGLGKEHDMLWCAYNAQGNLAVTWRDRRNAGTAGFWGAGYDFYYALSTDNGQTFSANQLLSSQFIGFDSVIADKGNDFMSCYYQADTLYTVWGDTRSGAMNIYFAKTIASTDTTLGITLLQGDEPQWSVFPNPAASVFNVQVGNQLLGKEISVYDNTGKKIYTSLIQSLLFTVPNTGWAAGAYFIKAGNAVKKVVKE